MEYNLKEDYIEGFADLGKYGRTGEQTTTVLAFILSSVSYNWKQAIFFAFSKGPVPGDRLKVIILDVIDSVEKTGLKIKSMVSDQGASNQKAITDLNVSEDHPYLERHGRKIYFNFDVPHLIKCYRNNLMKIILY